MLVLTRKPNQQLHIGNDIVITIVKVRGNTIRLGIEAPKDVRVLRSELEPKSLGGAASDSQASGSLNAPTNASASESEDLSEVDSAASADDQEAAQPQVAAQAQRAAQASAASTVIFEARIHQPAQASSPLKRFTAANRSQGAFAERNLEDSPLCHRSPQASDSASRPSGLHNYIAMKSRSGLLEQTAPRDKQPRNQDAQGGRPLTAQA